MARWVARNKKYRNNRDIQSNFLYGIDEYFANQYIYPELKGIIGLYINFDFMPIHKDFVANYGNISTADNKKIKKFCERYDLNSARFLEDIADCLRASRVHMDRFLEYLFFWNAYMVLLSSLKSIEFSDYGAECLVKYRKTKFYKDYVLDI